eukprot:CAMPEP_0194116100 /NCGR_PEP_ID=MMETSP0150-20130528/25635_1 /TAXON_ID=122233 /ORGANISM="Chaetoceros debilis, Strain MM31A-1" /LENGTH=71 /DNA_ID=CAMNT_0038806739 /DNA_START=12 /DNA_END=225 /DNA_ORIENTATION=+
MYISRQVGLVRGDARPPGSFHHANANGPFVANNRVALLGALGVSVFDVVVVAAAAAAAVVVAAAAAAAVQE